MIYLAILLIAGLIAIVLNFPVFGRLPSAEQLQVFKTLPNYREGSFQNLSHTPVKPEGVSYFTIMKGLAKKNPNGRPAFTLPSIKPNFAMEPDRTRLIWFGHSSYLIQSAGMNILIDPVFSKSTSPFTLVGNRSYPGTDFIDFEDLPDIDLLIISHDHYDHLDYPTIKKLKATTKLIITSIGVGAHLKRWGFDADRIRELNWNETYQEEKRFSITAMSARHFSGRMFKRNQSLWSSYVLKVSGLNLYLGGDSGYDTHFKAIGDQYGPFDLAILECGQYNENWPYIHMFPETTVQAAIDLGAKVLLPVHWGKFTLAQHDWNEPVKRAVAEGSKRGYTLTTPMLGESVWINESYPKSKWWAQES
jgi:L-ascorbate metabolism protein UlaG (beta-lactamase superfamily)